MRSKLNLTLATILTLLATSAFAQDWIGVVKRSKGQVLIERGVEQISAPAGTEVRRGDRVITGPDGYVNVRMRGATPVSVGPQAKVTLDRFIPQEQQVSEKHMPQILQGLASFFAVNRQP